MRPFSGFPVVRSAALLDHPIDCVLNRRIEGRGGVGRRDAHNARAEAVGSFADPSVRFQLNASENCIDRHLLTQPDATALIYEADEPSDGFNVTYQELHDQVCPRLRLTVATGVSPDPRTGIGLSPGERTQGKGSAEGRHRVYLYANDTVNCLRDARLRSDRRCSLCRICWFLR